RSNMAELWAAMTDAMLSLPPRRPTMAHSSRTRFLGGSRSATVRKNETSSSVMGRAWAALRTLRQPSQLGPLNHGRKRTGSCMAAMMLRIVGLVGVGMVGVDLGTAGGHVFLEARGGDVLRDPTRAHATDDADERGRELRVFGEVDRLAGDEVSLHHLQLDG